MRINAVRCAVALLMLSCTGLAKADEPTRGETLRAGTESTVAELENQWAQAQRLNDIDQLEPLLAERYASTETDGEVMSRAEVLLEERSTKYTTVEVEDLQVTAFENVAIANMVVSSRGTIKGKKFEHHARWTDTWAKMANGSWQCVASHGTSVKP